MINKLLYFTTYDISQPVGPSGNEFEFSKALVDKLHKNVWCVLPKPENEISHLTSKNTHFIKNISNCSLIFRLYYSCSIAKYIDSIVNKNNIDCIVIRLDSFPIIPIILVCFFQHKIFIKSCGFFWVSKSDKRKKFIKFIRKIREIMTLFLARRVLMIDAVTIEIAERLKKDVNNTVPVVYIDNATNIDKFRPKTNYKKFGINKSEFDPVIGFVGGYPSERGARQMVESGKLLLTKYPNLKIVVAGNDPGMPEIINLARQYSIIDKCYFLGVIPYSDVSDLINNFDICISFDKTENIQDMGNSGQKVRQYISCGKPVITIKQSTDFITKNKLGSIVNANDYNEIARCVYYWYEELKTNKEQVTSRLRKYAEENFSMRASLEKRLNMWNQIL